MTLNRRELAPAGYAISLGALLFSGVWYIVHRQIDLVMQVGLALVILGIATGVLLDPARVRQVFSGRQARYGSNALLLTLSFLGILVVVNYLAYRNTQRWDLTEDKVYSLAPETRLLLSELKAPVLIKGFYTPDQSSARDDIKLLLEQYRLSSGGKIAFEFVDPNADPVVAGQYNITRDGTLVVIMGEAFETLQYANEQDITKALVRLANPEQRKVYFLTGQGERSLDETGEDGYSRVLEALKSKNYQVETWNLLIDPQVPTDVLLVVVAGPRAPLSGDQVRVLEAYVEEGGSLVFLSDPALGTALQGAADPLADYVGRAWGIALENDAVVDLNSTLPLDGIASSYAKHPITDRLQGLASYFPLARSISVNPVEGQQVTPTALVLTGERSWGETDFEALQAGNPVEFDEGSDKLGPLTLGALAENPSTGSRVVVFGDSDFAANENFFGLANGDLLVNAIDWAAKQESLISITPKQYTQRFIVPPSVQSQGLIFLVTVVAIPALVALTGVSVWWRRRARP